MATKRKYYYKQRIKDMLIQQYIEKNNEYMPTKRRMYKKSIVHGAETYNVM